MSPTGAAVDGRARRASSDERDEGMLMAKNPLGRIIVDGFDRKKEISNSTNGAISAASPMVGAVATGLSRC